MNIPPKEIERICGEVAALRRLVQSLRQRTEEVSDHLSGSGAQRDLANFTRDSALFLYNAEQFLATAGRIAEEEGSLTQESFCGEPSTEPRSTARAPSTKRSNGQ